MGLNIQQLDAEYKEMFAALTAELGHTPSFSEAFELTEWHRLECVKLAHSQPINPKPGDPESSCPNCGSTPYLWPCPTACNKKRGDERGDHGGRLAECVECHKVWERPVQRGRPSLKCPECR